MNLATMFTTGEFPWKPRQISLAHFDVPPETNVKLSLIPFRQQSQHPDHHVGGPADYRSHAAGEPIPATAAVQRRDTVQHRVANVTESHYFVPNANQQW